MVSERQAGKPTGGRALFGMLLGVNLAALALLGVVLLVVVPKMAVVYEDFGTSLPPVTAVMVKMARARGAVLLGLGLLLAGQLALGNIAGRGRHLVLLVGSLLEMVLIVAVAFVVFVPYGELINSISRSNVSGG
ncbi:MAG: hypothetical protein ACUVXJ_10330 [Phycisphaerae bacterium]